MDGTSDDNHNHSLLLTSDDNHNHNLLGWNQLLIHCIVSICYTKGIKRFRFRHIGISTFCNFLHFGFLAFQHSAISGISALWHFCILQFLVFPHSTISGRHFRFLQFLAFPQLLVFPWPWKFWRQSFHLVSWLDRINVYVVWSCNGFIVSFNNSSTVCSALPLF